MPQLKTLKKNGVKLYPVTITEGIWDTTNNQSLAQTLKDLIKRVDDLENKKVITYE